MKIKTEQTTKKIIKKSAADRAKANADKQRRFRVEKTKRCKKPVRGCVSPEACAKNEIRDKTGWTDSSYVHTRHETYVRGIQVRRN